VELVCYRASSYLTPVRARAHGWSSTGRYHDWGSPATQYFSLHPLTPWAELVRNQRCRDLDDALETRIAVWAIRLVLKAEPETVDFDAADAGTLATRIAPAELVADDARECRVLADAHRADPSAAKVIRVPSAALPGTDNVVIFGRRRAIRYETTPLRAIQVPVAVSSVDGRLPRDLFRLVRRIGDRHAGYERWRRGERYELPSISTHPL
jgi:hypothetical protein